MNAADGIEKGEVFLTVTGTSAEAGDDGQAGRGNRVSGLITPYHPMTLEAAAGKNQVTHAGKLYNLAAAKICRRIVRDVAGAGGASCVLVSQIGRPVDDPQIADLCLQPEPPGCLPGLTAPVKLIVTEELPRLDELGADLLAGRAAVY